MAKKEKTKMDVLTTAMIEHICDNLCKYPADSDMDEDELADICADCEMGHYICEILNTHNKTLADRRKI